jgi:hypothetical protein
VSTKTTSEEQATANLKQYEAKKKERQAQRQQQRDNMATNLSTQLLIKGIQPVEIFTGADDQDPLTWLQSMDELFDAIKTEKNDRRRYLPMYFGKDIKKWYRNGEYNMDYDLFKEQFVSTFTSSGYKLKLYSKIINRHQRHDEPVQSYHYDILSLCSKLNHGMSESEKILHLLRGLKPSILQQVMMFDPKTCSDLLEQAKRAEAAAAIIQPQASMTTNNMPESIEETTAALRRTTINNNQQFDNLNQNGQQQSIFNHRQFQSNYNNNLHHHRQQTGASRLICYNCNGLGHYAYQCPSQLN